MATSRLRPKICKACGASFRGRAKRVYCSDACKYRYKYPPRDKKIKYGRTCVECGNIYDGYRNKYCSDECFAAACVRRRADGISYKKSLVLEAKLGPCMDCGGDFAPYIMDLHHRDPKEKSFEVSKFSDKSISAIMDEIEKCDLVCANCHRERHHGPNGLGQ